METRTERYERLMSNAASRLPLPRLRALEFMHPVDDPRFRFVATEIATRTEPWED